jgi:HD-GYP domain-containing protein (c-di-GMP phosphodiesterase class II)
MWLLDPATDTLRLVAADGTMPPPALPVTLHDTILGRAIEEARDVYAPLTRVREAGSADVSMWRYAMPLTGGDARGVAAIDFAGDTEPDHLLLGRISEHSHPSLVSALALHVARQETAEARALLDAARELSRLLDVNEIIRTLLERAAEMSGAATASVMLVDQETGELEIIDSVGLPEGVVSQTALSPGEGIAGWVMASGKPLVIEDLPGRATASRRHGVRTAVSVPIADENGAIGVLNVGCRVYAARFSAAHLKTLESLARMGAVALRNARAVESTGDLYFETLKALALALETKDPYAHGGTERVVACATAIGREMGLDDRESRALEMAALLHDIGMIASGEAAAATDRPLTTTEWGLLKMHPVIAAEILEHAPALREVAPIVYHHHEHYDGTGYVNGTSATEIPLASRILAVADAYVAMTSPRPYRSAMAHEEALTELRSLAGTQFDPHVVQALVDLATERPELTACWNS